MTAHDELRNDIAEAYHYATSRCSPGGGCPGVTECCYAESLSLTGFDAVLAKLAEGAYQRAMVAQGSPTPQMNDAHNRMVTRNVIAATLGLDPAEVPT